MVLTADTAATPLSRTKSVSDRLYAESALAFLNGFALVTFADQACHSRHHLKQMATSSPLAAVSEQGAESPKSSGVEMRRISRMPASMTTDSGSRSWAYRRREADASRLSW
jgi:hypothetical protein